MAGKPGSNQPERVKIQEKALQDLADKLKRREAEFDEQMEEVFEELKAIKLFLSRNMPEFKKEFPNIRKKVKAA